MPKNIVVRPISLFLLLVLVALDKADGSPTPNGSTINIHINKLQMTIRTVEYSLLLYLKMSSKIDISSKKIELIHTDMHPVVNSGPRFDSTSDKIPEIRIKQKKTTTSVIINFCKLSFVKLNCIVSDDTKYSKHIIKSIANTAPVAGDDTSAVRYM